MNELRYSTETMQTILNQFNTSEMFKDVER